MIFLTAIFLITALSAYVLFGGADFGAGVLEATLPSRELRAKLQNTLAPVWEANHVWLIAVVVILFVGFPRFYALALTRLYLPISISLFSILVRGTFFTLRKYDPAPGGLARFYSIAFRFSSALAPFSFGLVVAGLLSQHPASDEAGLSFHAVYVAPWWDFFGITCGVFIAALFGYLASVFFYGELSVSERERAVIGRRIWIFFVVTFLLGGLVLALGAATGRVGRIWPLHPVQWGGQVVAALAIFVLSWAKRNSRVWVMRFAAGAQVMSILAGWFYVQYPVLLRIDSEPLSMFSAAAPEVTLLWLNVGLVVVLLVVVPLLVLLYRVFDKRGASAPH